MNKWSYGVLFINAGRSRGVDRFAGPGFSIYVYLLALNGCRRDFYFSSLRGEKGHTVFAACPLPASGNLTAFFEPVSIQSP
jgi:hypothetical protein